MLFRSTNNKFTHHQGDFLSNTDDSSHGVHLAGGSTGGIVQPCGDEANIALNVLGKGIGNVILGTTGGSVLTQSTGLLIGAASTTGLALVQRYTIQVDSAALVLPALGAGDTVSTLTGVTTNAVLVWAPRATFSTSYGFQVMCSTANEVRLRIFNHDNATMGSGESSNRGTLLAFNF